VAVVLATIRRRVQRLLGRRNLEPVPGEPAPADALAESSPVLAALAGASVGARVALGPRAGRRVSRLGDTPDPPALASRGPQQAHREGFDLHANVRVPPRDRARLEQLCRYVLRPPLAQTRLGLLPDGRVVVTLKATWRRSGRCSRRTPSSMASWALAGSIRSPPSDDAPRDLHHHPDRRDPGGDLVARRPRPAPLGSRVAVFPAAATACLVTCTPLRRCDTVPV
jgi:hypothetical protein